MNISRFFRRMACAALLSGAAFAQEGFRPNDPLFASQWPVSSAGVNKIWRTQRGSPAVRIAIVDTGVATSHPELVGNLWTNPGEIAGNGVDDDGNGFVDDTSGWDFVNNDNSPADDQGRGTAMAGVIGAAANNGVGTAGMCWEVTLIPVKVLGASATGSVAHVAAGLAYARAAGARVICTSWTGSTDSPALQAEFQAARAAGILVVATAGTTHVDRDAYPLVPMNYDRDNLIITASTVDGAAKSGGSGYGKLSVDLGAPGEGVPTTVRNGSTSTYTAAGLAAAHVAGAAGLLLAEYPGLPASTLRRLILETARPGAYLREWVATGGSLDAHAAFLAARGLVLNPGDPLEFLSTPGGPPGASPLRLTLSNPGIHPVVFTASVDRDWAEVTPVSGTLDPGQDTELSLSAAPAWTALAAGVSTGMLSVARSDCLQVLTRPLRARVQAVADAPFSEDFESGSLGPFWLAEPAEGAWARVTDRNRPARGARHLLLDVLPGHARLTPVSVTARVNLSNTTSVVLRATVKAVSAAAARPVAADARDGVEVSADGRAWHRAGGWGTPPLDAREFAWPLDPVLASAGIGRSGPLWIRLTHTCGGPGLALALDDLRVDAVPLPQSIAPASGRVSVGAAALAPGEPGLAGTRSGPLAEGAPAAALTLHLAESIGERDGLLFDAGMVELAGTLDRDLRVSLVSSDPGELRLPDSVVLRRGETRVVFDLLARDDNLSDGAVAVTVEASAPGVAPALATVRVMDSEVASFRVEPFASPQWAGQSFPLRLQALDINGEPAGGYAGTGTVQVVRVDNSVQQTLASAVFARGLWGGLATVSAPHSAFRVRVVDGISSGFSDPFTVLANPVIASTPTRVNDIAYDPLTQRLYATVPSSSTAQANRLVVLDPANGAVLASHPVTNATVLAMAPEGGFLVVATDNSANLRGFHTATGQWTPPMYIGASVPGHGTRQVLDLDIPPGNTNRFAVVWNFSFSSFSTETVLYENRAALPSLSTVYNRRVVFGADGALLYGGETESAGAPLLRFSAGPAGVALLSSHTNLFTAGDYQLVRAGSRLYANGGRVVDVDTLTLVGSTLLSGPLAVDAAGDRLHVVNGNPQATLVSHRASSLERLRTRSYAAGLSIPGTNARAVLCGPSRLAYLANPGLGGVNLVNLDHINSTNHADLVVTQNITPDPVELGGEAEVEATIRNLGPAVATDLTVSSSHGSGLRPREAALGGWQPEISAALTRFRVPSLGVGESLTLSVRCLATATGVQTLTVSAEAREEDPNPSDNAHSETTAVAAPGERRRFALTSLFNNGSAHSPARDRVYAAARSDSLRWKNHLLELDTQQGRILRSWRFDHSVRSPAVSHDGQYLYLYEDTAGLVRRFLLPDMTPDISFPVSGAPTLVAHPASAGTVAVVLAGQTSLYDDATRRGAPLAGMATIAFSPDGSHLFGVNNSSSLVLTRAAVTPAGLVVATQRTTPTGIGSALQFAAGALHLNHGHVYDPTTLAVLAKTVSPGTKVDAGLPDTYLMVRRDSSAQTFLEMDARGHHPLGATTVPGLAMNTARVLHLGGGRLLLTDADLGLALVDPGLVHPLPRCDLSVSLREWPEPSLAGQPLTLRWVARNAGPATAAGTRLHLDLPAGARLLGVRGGVAIPSASTDRLEFRLGDIPPGGEAVGELDTLPLLAGALRATATVSCATPEFRPLDDSHTEEILVRAAPSAHSVAYVTLPSSDLGFNPSDGRLVFSTLQETRERPDSLAVMDPSTREVLAYIPAGSAPGRIAFAENATGAAVMSAGNGTLIPFQPAGYATLPPVQLGSGGDQGFSSVLDMDYAPDATNLLVAAHAPSPGSSPPVTTVHAWDRGVRLAGALLQPFNPVCSDLAFAGSPNRFYSFDTTFSTFPYMRLNLGAGGITLVDQTPLGSTYAQFSGRMHGHAGRIFTTRGKIFDAETRASLATIPSCDALLVDPGARRLFAARDDVVTAYDLDTYASLGTLILDHPAGDCHNLLRWGVNGLALVHDDHRVSLVRTPLVPHADLSLTADDARESVTVAGPLRLSATVANRGPSRQEGARVVLTLPPGVTVLASASSQGASAPLANGLEFNLGAIDANASAWVTVDLRPATAGWLEAVFAASGALGDPEPGDNLASTLTWIEPDADLDGIPDAYESAHGLNPSFPGDAALDADGDGHTNLAESLAGTRADDAASVFRVSSPAGDSPRRITLATEAGRFYQVERTLHLAAPDWQPVGEEITGDGTVREIADPDAPPDRAWYRARILD